MKIAKYVEIKSAVGQRTALLSPKADALKEVYPDNHLNAESTLEFMLPANSPKIAELTPECQIWAAGRVYTLLREQAVETIRDEKNTLWAKFIAAERWKELESSFVEPSLSNDPLSPIPSDLAVIIVGGGFNLTGGLYQTGTAAHALYAVLQGSGWTMGICDVTGTHDIEMEKESRLALIKEIQNIWGGYLVWDSVNKIVHLRNANLWQNYTGFQIRYRKNLKHITRTQSNKLVTKMYAFGHDDLDIASVNGGIKYLTNNSYSTRELTGIYKNQDIYDALELKEKASDELALNCHPRFKYTVKMVDLRTLPEYEHEDFTVGDMADVVDADVAPDSPRPRIIRHKYNLFKPWECDIDLGDPIERIEEQLKASFDTAGFVNGIFNGNGQSSGASIEDLTITNAKIQSLEANKITTQFAKITTAQIENLEVGSNVTMGANARISWGQVTNQPTIIDSNTVTQISRNEISTATIRVDQLYGNIANLAEEVNIGSSSQMPSSYRSINFYNGSGNRAGISLDSQGNLILNSTFGFDIISHAEFSVDAPSGINLEGYNSSNYISGANNYITGDTSIGGDLIVHGNVGFYGTSPISKQTAQILPTTATLTNVITTVNGIMGKLKNLGLLDTYT